MAEGGGLQGDHDGGGDERAAGETTAQDTWRCKFVYALLVFAVVGLLDPFGVSDLLRRYSQSLTNQIFGSLYPSAGQQEITVLLLTERTIDRHGGYWPVRMGVHADALSQVLDAEPAAVFVDLWFKDDARDDPTVADLVRVLDLYEAMDIPVYLASREARDDQRQSTREDLKGRTHEVWAPKVVDERDRTSVVYPLYADRIGSRRHTAAMALYERWLQVNRPELTPSGPEIYREALSRSEFPDDLHVVWGTRSSGVEHGAIACEHLEEGVFSALLTRVMRDSGGFLSDCPYTRTILLDDLTHYGDDDLEEALAGKIVLYGAAPEGAVDLVSPPTHASLPGVYLHAMALDNLIVWGQDYVREAAPGSWRSWVFGLFQLIALVGTVAVGVAVTPSDPTRPDRSGSKLRPTLVAGALHVCAFASVLGLNAFLAWLAYAWLRLAPINWIGMIVAFGVIVDEHVFCPLRCAEGTRARLCERLGPPAGEAGVSAGASASAAAGDDPPTA